MSDIYCSYFDHNYLSRATVMIESLRRFDPATPIHVLALSELCEQILNELALPNVEVVPLAALEEAYPELVGIKSARTLIEYYFTLTPFLPHYLFSRTTADRITYLDADIYFFSSPEPLLSSLGDASVAITPHRFSFSYQTHVVYGHFNVAWITFRRCAEGLECLQTYKDECTEWCHDRLEGYRYADQKYLDAWPGRYASLKIIDHKGVDLAVWNVENYDLRRKKGIVMVDDDPLVFYHFVGLKVMSDGSSTGGMNRRVGRSATVLLQHVFIPYRHRLKLEIQSLLERFPSLAVAQSSVRYLLPQNWTGA